MAWNKSKGEIAFFHEMANKNCSDKLVNANFAFLAETFQDVTDSNRTFIFLVVIVFIIEFAIMMMTIVKTRMGSTARNG